MVRPIGTCGRTARPGTRPAHDGFRHVTARCRCRCVRRPAVRRTATGCSAKGRSSARRVGIDEEFRRIEAMSVTRIVRSGCAQSVTLAWLDVRQRNRGTRRRYARAARRACLDLRPTRRRGTARSPLACAENTATLTPSGTSVTPSGSGQPESIRRMVVGSTPSGATGRHELAVHPRVVLRRTAPAHVDRHRVQLQPMPRRRAVATATTARSSASASASCVTGANMTPVPPPAASAISLASTTVSRRPPTRATTGIVP